MLAHYGRECRQVVGDWLLFKDDYAAVLEAERAAVLNGSASPDLALGTVIQAGETSRPTENAALRLLAIGDANGFASWLAFVDEVEALLDWKRRVFLELRREYRHHCGRDEGWVVPVQRRYAETMAKVTGSDEADHWVEGRATLWRWWEQITGDAAILAAQRGLFKQQIGRRKEHISDV